MLRSDKEQYACPAVLAHVERKVGAEIIRQGRIDYNDIKPLLDEDTPCARCVRFKYYGIIAFFSASFILS